MHSMRLVLRALDPAAVGKRAFDIAAATVGLLATLPLLLVAAIGIRLQSPGPILYPALRIGRHGRPFTMFKFRTMHHERPTEAPRITREHDDRVFPWGAWLRRTKIDELPQLWNILRGDMSFVGPRPEDPFFVSRHYTPVERGTLAVRPGLTSPGTLYHDSHCTHLLDADDVERIYVERILPTKLALDLVYLMEWSLGYDLRLIGRTLRQIADGLRGKSATEEPPELARARAARLLPRSSRPQRSARASQPAAAHAARTAHVAALAFAFVAAAACAGETIAPASEWLYDPTETILVGAGDIGDCTTVGDEATAALLDAIPGTVYTTGDNAYPGGRTQDFANCYHPSWGRHKARTRPTAGNHEYDTPGASGYYEYFGDAAGPAGVGYYSYDLGAWHVIVLNSNLAMNDGSPQLTWLITDLAANPRPCVVAYWHHPRFSSGAFHGSDARLRVVWDALYAAGADLVLNGHEHVYERFAPMTPAGESDPTYGIRQFTIGTGGTSPYEFDVPLPNSEIRQAGVTGVLALRLLDDSYQWHFKAQSDSTFKDEGGADCHGAPSAAVARAAAAR